MSTSEINKTTTSSVAAKTPGRPGRKKNSTLGELDAELEGQCLQEAEEASSSSKRVAKDPGGPSKPKKTKKTAKKKVQESSDDDSDPSESDSDSDPSSSSDSSAVESDEPRRKLKKTGFISFKGVGLITPDSKARLRKIQRLLESVANLVPKIDQEGKEALKRFHEEVLEYRDFTRELIRSTRAEIPDRNPIKKRTVKQLKIIRDVLIELGEDVDVASEMPMMGAHILDWSDQEGLKKILGPKTARRLRTSLKGQRKIYKPIFKKSPADIARTWLSAEERRKKNFNPAAAGYSRDSNKGKQTSRDNQRSSNRDGYGFGGGSKKTSGFGKGYSK